MSAVSMAASEPMAPLAMRRLAGARARAGGVVDAVADHRDRAVSAAQLIRDHDDAAQVLVVADVERRARGGALVEDIAVLGFPVREPPS